MNLNLRFPGTQPGSAPRPRRRPRRRRRWRTGRRAGRASARTPAGRRSPARAPPSGCRAGRRARGTGPRPRRPGSRSGTRRRRRSARPSGRPEPRRPRRGSAPARSIRAPSAPRVVTRMPTRPRTSGAGSSRSSARSALPRTRCRTGRRRPSTSARTARRRGPGQLLGGVGGERHARASRHSAGVAEHRRRVARADQHQVDAVGGASGPSSISPSSLIAPGVERARSGSRHVGGADEAGGVLQQPTRARPRCPPRAPPASPVLREVRPDAPTSSGRRPGSQAEGDVRGHARRA